MNKKEALDILEEVLLVEKQEFARRLQADADPLIASRLDETKAQMEKTMKLEMAFYYFRDGYE